jgi:hypothetical protein
MKLSKLDKNILKMTHHKTKPKQKKNKKKHKTYLPLTSLPLFSCRLLMLVMLSSLSSSFVPKNGCSHMFHHAKKI